MKAAQVNKLYSKLTPHEQAALVFEAAARLDDEEVDAILEHVEKRDYRCCHADYQRRTMGLRNLVGLYGTHHWRTLALLSMAENSGETDKTTALLSQLAALEAALTETCDRYKVNIAAVKKLAECVDTECFACGASEEWMRHYLELFASAVDGYR